MTIKKLTITALVASGLALGASVPAAAGSIPTLTAAVAQAAPGHTVDVYWRGGWRGYGPGLAFGLAAGAIAGAAIAAPYYGGGPAYYYGAPMPSYYSRPVYAAPYAYAPPVYAPPVYGGGYYAPYRSYYGYGYRRCYTDEGYGRWTPCDTTGQR